MGWGVVRNAVVQAPRGPPAQQRKEWAGRGTLQNSSPGAKQAFFLHTQEGFPKGNRHFPQATPMSAEASLTCEPAGGFTTGVRRPCLCVGEEAQCGSLLHGGTKESPLPPKRRPHTSENGWQLSVARLELRHPT